MALPDRGPSSDRLAARGIEEGFSLGNYLLLVDFTTRLYREGKATLSRRGGRDSRASGHQCRSLASRLDKLRRGNLLVRSFATSRAASPGGGGATGPEGRAERRGLPGKLRLPSARAYRSDPHPRVTRASRHQEEADLTDVRLLVRGSPHPECERAGRIRDCALLDRFLYGDKDEPAETADLHVL